MSEPIWMPHAGHFIGGLECSFHLNTYVNGFIVSTVGEYRPSAVYERGVLRIRRDDDPPKEIGPCRLYETMVFPARPAGNNRKCCPFEVSDLTEIDFAGYNADGDAYAGHLAMVEKWSTKEALQ